MASSASGVRPVRREEGAVGSPGMYLVAGVDEWRLGLSLAHVDRVVWAVAVTPLPGAPDHVLGAISVEGALMPVVDVRHRLGLPRREVRPQDRLIVAHTARRSLALWVDQVQGIIEPAAQDVVQADAILPGLGRIEGVIRLPDGMVLIHRLGAFLSLHDEDLLDEALGGRRP